MFGKGAGASLPIGQGVVGRFPTHGGAIVRGHAFGGAPAKEWAEKIIFDSCIGRSCGSGDDSWPRWRAQSSGAVWKRRTKCTDSLSRGTAAGKPVRGC